VFGTAVQSLSGERDCHRTGSACRKLHITLLVSEAIWWLIDIR
jgi:hypothetical protein